MEEERSRKRAVRSGNLGRRKGRRVSIGQEGGIQLWEQEARRQEE